MAKTNSSIYYLIKVDNFTGDIEYFDFEMMDFSPEIVKPVPLSNIDALTTVFEDGQELDNYVSKTTRIDREYSYSFEIFYIPKKNSDFRYFNPVWNDSTLNSISKVSNGEVDFSNSKNYDTLFEIIDTIKRPESGLARKIIKSQREATRLTDKNKVIIGALASSNKQIEIETLEPIFSNYKEFRALYLNYKDNKSQKISLGEHLKKVRLLFDKK